MGDTPQHRFVSNLTYDLPFGKGRKFGGGAHSAIRAIAGGWTVSATHMASSGAFLTPTWAGRDTTGTRYTTSRTPLRPDVLRDPRLSGSERTLQRWFDPTAFTAPAPGQFGTAGSGLVVGPGFSVLNAGVFKGFPIRERARLRAELTASNQPPERGDDHRHPGGIPPRSRFSAQPARGDTAGLVRTTNRRGFLAQTCVAPLLGLASGPGYREANESAHRGHGAHGRPPAQCLRRDAVLRPKNPTERSGY